MKRSWLFIAILILLVLTCVALYLYSTKSLNIGLSFNLIILLIIIGFAVLIGLIRFRSAAKGEPQEDELSKKIVRKASSVSYFVSLYLWLVLFYLSNNKKIETHILFVSGLIGMAIIFFVSWLIIYRIGIKNE